MVTTFFCPLERKREILRVSGCAVCRNDVQKRRKISRFARNDKKNARKGQKKHYFLPNKALYFVGLFNKVTASAISLSLRKPIWVLPFW